MHLKRVVHGVYGGLLGGLAFGAVMAMMGMLLQVGELIGRPTVRAGFLLHMVISAFIGAIFGATLGRIDKGPYSGVFLGFVYGLVWWLLGPLTLMPLFLGMGLGVNWNVEAAVVALPSLTGHLVYGGILGIVFSSLQTRSAGRESAVAQGNR